MMSEIKPILIAITDIIEKIKEKCSNFIENKMAMHWAWIVAVWICSWFTLLWMSQASKAITWISVGLLAVHVTNWIHQAIKTAIPKRLIQDTEGKTVVITGCDSGFGRQLAVRLDQLGFKVFAGCLFPNGEGAKGLLEEASDRLQILEIDVTKNSTIVEAYKVVNSYLKQTEGRLWALVNNAGIAAVTEIEWCPLEVYRKVFDVNSLGLIRVTKTFLPLVRQNEGNRIIIVASLAGRYTFPGFSAYSMSKHAAVSFADALRLEMRKWKVSVHTVEPTLYRTPIAETGPIHSTLDKLWEECPEDIKKSYGKAYLEDFKSTMSQHMNKAKPLEKIHEVIDDMVHAVAGVEPKSRYVPSLQTQLRVHVLSSLPTDLLDDLLAKSQPTTPPADIEGMKRTKFSF